ncbi:MAG TPA: exodeoxyribonuclease VII large subunit [Elusimicrobia bacterium]|nr:exodeoxyribonuclease VII large subunit [Elusimicrobiota bacterium]HBT60266.1 exodeoxyribonuclease VII large subunit [Elusimicrobiota bacterium]
MKVYSVSEINGQIHELLEASFPELWVEGEISNCRAYPSGHTYLTLKDENAQIQAVLFKGAALGVKFKPQDGLKVLVRARVSSYVKRGDVQLIISAMEPREKGALQLAFEQLKAKLAAEGLFDEARKKPLPLYPRRVGIVTSGQGAAVHDMITVLSRRWPSLEILVYPVKVQGEGAKEEISQAIADLNKLAPDTDVLLVGRGGGSIEDLWAFNEEIVARAIAASAIPVISCVGHETDTTIADFVSDVRAPTPSAAAELAAPDRAAVLARLDAFSQDLLGSVMDRIRGLEQRVSFAARHPFLQSPHRMYEERIKRVDELFGRLPEAARQVLLHAEKDLRLQMEKLDAFSPLKVLGRGYAIAEKWPERVILRRDDQVRPGDRVRVRLQEGSIHCEVKYEQDR